jgi:cobalt-zinc-cadmium efflux system outer membrane protein
MDDAHDASWRCVVDKRIYAAVTAVVLSWPARASAESSCGPTIRRADVVGCALQASLVVRAEMQTGEALEGRRLAQTPILPSNPQLSVTGARRNGDGRTVTNWSATLAQEVEIAGQRGARRHAAELAAVAQSHRVEVARRDAAAATWVAYFESLAAVAELRLATRVAIASSQIGIVARAMADKGVLSPVDADVADATHVTFEQSQLAAERRTRSAQLTLTTMLGIDPTRILTIEGELLPLRGVEEEARAALGRDPGERPEVQAFDAERRAEEATAWAYARSRIPNVTVSAFAANDGFSERVLGLGLSVPIPLPQPIGRMYSGEIAEANALARRAGTEAERARRQARLELFTALGDYDSRKRAREAFTEERLSRAEQGVDAISREIAAGRLSVRDALLSQQALIGVLRASVEARLALCIASVDLARASGIALAKGNR